MTGTATESATVQLTVNSSGMPCAPDDKHR